MASYRISLFDGIHIEIDEQPVSLAYDKVRGLLAYLVLENRLPHRRESLAGLLWPDQTEKDARHSLSQALLKLRQGIDSQSRYVVSDRHTVALHLPPGTDVDVTSFIDLLDRCSNHVQDSAELGEDRFSWLVAAVPLYTGPFMAGLSLPDAPPFEQWLTQRREMLRQRMIDALSMLTTYHEQHGQVGPAIRYAQRLLEIEPWQEETHRQLMRLLLYNGQRSRAIAQYLTCVQQLRDELEVEPAPETFALFKLIESASPYPPHNLTPPLTPFVGRETELAQLTSWLAKRSSRLISVVGPGGIGKSRFVLNVAHRQLRRPTDQAQDVETYAYYTHGVFWVGLAGISSTAGLVPTIAEAIGLTLDSGESGLRPRTPSQQLLSYLRNRRILLILDNFEQLLAPAESNASTDIVHQILTQAPEVQLVVTSRERLQLYEEQLFRLEGLRYPNDRDQGDANFSAMMLFQQAAGRIRPEDNPDGADLEVIGSICRFLEGSPLAIELAASAVNVLAPRDILRSLEKSLELLTTHNRHVPERHRSMRAAFNTSWDRLATSFQQLLAQLSIFKNGFTLPAANAVAGATPQDLLVLINHSLLRFDSSIRRYQFHEVLRQFAVEALGNLPIDIQEAVVEKHATYFLQLFTDSERALKGADQIKTLSLLEREIEDGRQAWSWACAYQPEELFAATNAIPLFFERLGRHPEGGDLCERALEALRISPETAQGELVKGRLWAWKGRFHAAQFEWTACQQALAESRQRLGELAPSVDRAFLCLQESRLLWKGDKDRARDLAQLGLILATEFEDQWLMAEAHNLLGRMSRAMSQFHAAQTHLNQSLTIREMIQDQSGLAHTLSHLSLLLMDIGQFETAFRHAQNGLSIYEQTNDIPNIANTHNSLGLICGFLGRNREALQHFDRSIDLLVEIERASSLAITGVWSDFIHMMLARNYQSVVDNQRSTYETFREKRHQRGLAYTSMLLTWATIGAEQDTEAVEFSSQAIDLFTALGQTKEAAECSALRCIATQGDERVAAMKTHLDVYGRFIIDSHTFFPAILSLVALTLVEVHLERYSEGLVIYALLQSVPFVTNGAWFIDVLDPVIELALQGGPAEIVSTLNDQAAPVDIWPAMADVLSQALPEPPQHLT